MREGSFETVFCLSDIFKLFLKKKKKIFFYSSLLSFLVFIICLSSPSQYKSEATFLELQDKEENISIKDLLVSSSGTRNSSKASVIMLSDANLSSLIQDLGLQAKVINKRSCIISFFVNCWENIVAESRRSLKELDDFEFKDVYYLGEKTFRFYLRFIDFDSFELLDDKKKSLGLGKIKMPFNLEKSCSFTLQKTPKNLKINKFYRLTFSSMAEVESSLAKKIKIESEKESKNILSLSLKMRDRHLAAKILNLLMEKYQKYLKEENREFAAIQLAYLEERQDLLNKHLKQNLEEYVSYLTENLGNKGFLNLDQELDALVTPHNKYLNEMVALDLELNRLKKADVKDPYIVDDSKSANELRKISFELSDLRQEKDSLDLSLFKQKEKFDKGKEKFSNQKKLLLLDEKVKEIDSEVDKLKNDKLVKDDLLYKAFGDEFNKLCLKRDDCLNEKEKLLLSIESSGDLRNISKKNRQLSSLKTEKNRTLDLIKCLEEGIDLPSDMQLYFIKLLGSEFAFFISDEDKKKDLKDYLKKHVHLLEIKENMLSDSTFFLEDDDFATFDLEMARKIYAEYSQKLDDLNLQIEELKHGRVELAKEEFEISSLSLILKDPVSLSVIETAGKIGLEIKDGKNHLQKNISRLKEELSVQKLFLNKHIKELIDLKEINKELLLEKTDSLKRIILGGINQKIFLLNTKAKNFIDARIENLNTEKILLQDKILELQKKMEVLPSRWKMEKLLQLKSDMNIKMMQATTQLLETKTISHHLHQIGSKPLDKAVAAYIPEDPKLRFVFLLSFIVSIIFFYCFFFVKSALLGFDVSLGSLAALNQHVGGVLSVNCIGEEKNLSEKDLETLRDIASSVKENEKAKVISLIGNGGPNYSFHLVKLFGKSEKKVLLMFCDFSFPPDSADFFKSLGKKEKNILMEKRGDYDFIHARGSSDFSTEAVGSERFANFISELSKTYDYVFMYDDVSLKFSRAKMFLKISDMVVVTINDETMQEIKPYVEWRNDNYCRYLSFIAIS